MACRLLIVVTSLVVELGLQMCRLQQLQHMGSVVVAQGVRCPMACEIFPAQELNPCHLRWQANSQTLDDEGSLRSFF